MLKRVFAKQQLQRMLYNTQRSQFSTLTMADEESKHRAKLALYDLVPKLENCWVAPNATVVGEVRIQRFASVWYNSVIRGDINRVE